MKLLRQFPVMAFTLVLLSIVGLCIAQRSVAMLLVAGGLAVLSWYVTEGPRGRVLPAWVSSLLVIAVSLNVFVELLQQAGAWIEVLGRFAVWITVIKLYERKSPRDYGQLLLLTLLLVITASIQSVELLFGVVLLLYVVLGVYVLLLYQVYTAHERAKLERRRRGPRRYQLLPPVKPVIGPRVGLHFRVLTAGVGLAAFVLSVLVFAVFPRNLGRGVVPFLTTVTAQRQTGFTETIDLRAGNRLGQSRRPVLSARLLDSEGEPVIDGQTLLLRGGVLDVYDGSGRWRSSAGPLRPVATLPPGFAPLGDRPPEPALSYTLEVEPFSRQDVVFAMSVPVAVATDTPQSFLFDPRLRVIRRPEPGASGPYVIQVQPVPTDPTLEAMGGGEGRVAIGRLSNERIEQLGRQLLAAGNVESFAPGRSGSEQRYRWNRLAAGVFTAYLQSGEFQYVTDLSDVITAGPDAGQGDPNEQFLLVTKRGHCEYFASAFAALCQNVEVPVRLVTGYVGYEFDEASEAYVVLESNAHAWAEVRTGPGRWTENDPTPPATLRELHELEATLADRLSWFYQRFEGSWNTGIVSFDSTAQARLAESLDFGWADRFARGVQASRDWAARVNRAFYFGPAGYIWMGVVAFALLLAVAVLLRLMRRSRRLRRGLRLERVDKGEHQRMLRQLGFYVDMLSVLRKARQDKPAWRPPLDHAAALQPTHADAAGLVRRITGLFYEARFGARSLTPQEMREGRSMVQQLAGSLGVRI